MPEPQARFEFRIWGKSLDDLHSRLDQMTPASEPRESAETYILSRFTDTANVKIRDALLDIKVLVEQRGQLERWRPEMKSGFPLEARTIVETILPVLNVAPHAAQRSAYTLEQLIEEIVRQNSDLAPVNVSKKRYGYKLPKCTAEFAILEVEGGNLTETVQVETEDPAAAVELIERLGLSTHPNVSYIRHLKKTIGMA
jgi:hypothetical protein